MTRAGWLALLSSSPLAFAVLAVGSSGAACSDSGNSLDGGKGPPSDGGADVPAPKPGSIVLASLSVTGPKSAEPGAPLALIPAFSREVHDYYVRCAAGPNDVTVTMTAPEGIDSVLLQPTTSPRASHQTQTLTVVEGQAIVAAATDGTAYDEYWVRCIPHDFPAMKWQSHGARPPGYYLVGTNFKAASASASYAMVLDSNGVPVWYYPADNTGVYDVDSLAPGTVSFLPYPTAPWLPFEIHDLSPLEVTGAGPPGPELDNHELQRLPNGHYLVYTIPFETGFDLSSLTIPGSGASLGKNEAIASCKIVEVDPTSGNQVWTWDVADHFDPNQSCTYAQPGAANWFAPDGGPVFDVFHCNSIDVDPANGNLLVSVRSMDSVFYVDRSTSKVLWKMGGTPASKDGAAYVPVGDPFLRQHDARLLPGWAATSCGGHGQISMFDDETAGPINARAIVYDVDVGVGSGCPSAGASVAWQYDGAQTSLYMGSFRLLPDGSRTVGWGVLPMGGLILTEVDEAQDDLLDLYFTPGSSYRAIKVPLRQLDLGLLRSTAGIRVGTW